MIVIDDPLLEVREPSTIRIVLGTGFTEGLEGWRVRRMARLPESCNALSLPDRLLSSVSEPYWGRAALGADPRPVRIEGYLHPTSPPWDTLTQQFRPLVRVWSMWEGLWVGPSHRELTDKKSQALLFPEGLAQELRTVRAGESLVLVESETAIYPQHPSAVGEPGWINPSPRITVDTKGLHHVQWR